MPRFVAFLRAINVGGRTVKMDALARVFEGAGCSNVETFIASGNVLFDAPRSSEKTLRARIEQALEKQLGFTVTTFLRDAAEVRQIAEHEPFAAGRFRTPESRLFVALLAEPLSADRAGTLLNHGGSADEFQLEGRDLYWLCHVRSNESEFSGPKLEKTIGQPTTVRNINTLRRIAAKLG